MSNPKTDNQLLPKGMTMQTKIIATTSLAVFMLASPAHANGWFLHKFGELRAYHGSWLNVCAEKGNGACRTVQLPIKSGATESFFSQRRASLHMDQDGYYALEIFQRNMPTPPLAPITINIDGEVTTLDSADWKIGEKDVDNVLESFTVTNRQLIAKWIPAMKAGKNMTIKYGVTGGERSQAQFDLYGFTSATKALTKHIKDRK